jgi:hypothetical protein
MVFDLEMRGFFFRSWEVKAIDSRFREDVWASLEMFKDFNWVLRSVLETFLKVGKEKEDNWLQETWGGFKNLLCSFHTKNQRNINTLQFFLLIDLPFQTKSVVFLHLINSLGVIIKGGPSHGRYGALYKGHLAAFRHLSSFFFKLKTFWPLVPPPWNTSFVNSPYSKLIASGTF